MSWTRALQKYLVSPPHIRYRDGASVFERVCRAHLHGSPGHTIDVRSLPLLRRLRGEMLKSGTPEQKARTLETILACYSNANCSYTYDPVRSEKENHLLTLEQLQCLVEAQIAGVPVRAVHYRFLLQSPQLSQLSPNVPRLLFRKVANAEGVLTDDARVDVSVGLASGGHWEEALQLCPRFRLLDVIERVASSQRHGWRHACTLVSHLKEEAVVQEESYLVSTAAALALRFAATRDMAIGRRMETLIEAYFLQHRETPPPKRVIDYFISACSPEQWRFATGLVMRYNGGVEDAARIPLGKVMALMNGALQWERALLLYQAVPSALSSHERQHAAVHNHALVALAKGNLWQQAIRFYASQPAKNLHTYNVWLRMVVLERRIPFASVWESCIEAFQRIEKPDHRFAEGLAHLLASIGVWAAALNVAKTASEKTPRVLITAISAAAMASNERVAWKAAKELSSYRRGLSAKQFCTAVAIVGCCTKNAPQDLTDAMADALDSCTISQEQFDDAMCHLGRCMALLGGAARNDTNAETPSAIRLILRREGAERNAASWVFALALLKKMSDRGWSLKAVAPAMLSSGLGASIAIRFLPG
ncbi:hypothetical protein TcYC6_0124090 [Trypanosoma cruzi]|nr:hypothetical protein TcYC6_0124090 [Trypanosoma cruzi]